MIDEFYRGPILIAILFLILAIIVFIGFRYGFVCVQPETYKLSDGRIGHNCRSDCYKVASCFVSCDEFVVRTNEFERMPAGKCK